MNVITGFVVNGAIKQAEHMKNTNFCEHIRECCGAAGGDGLRFTIDRKTFNACMAKKQTLAHLNNLGIEVTDAQDLFTFFDEDGSESIDADELIDGLVRLRAGASFL